MPLVSATRFLTCFKTAQMFFPFVLFYENSPEEILFDNPQDLVRRLYKVTGINTKKDVKNGKTYLYGNIELRFHQNAQKKDDVKMQNGVYKNNEVLRQGIVLSHKQFKALVEGVDFGRFGMLSGTYNSLSPAIPFMMASDESILSLEPLVLMYFIYFSFL